MLAIYKREMKFFFYTLLGYAFVGVFLLMSGIFFTINNVLRGVASFSPVLSSVSYLMVLMTPILTMRLLAEEKKLKTDQIMLTSPVSVKDIVFGKFLAALTCLMIGISMTIIYPVILYIYGDPYIGEIIMGYTGCMLVGASLISVGLFISSVSENQLSAALTTLGFLMILLLTDTVANNLSDGMIKNILRMISPFTQLRYFRIGLLTLSAVIYNITFIIFFLFATAISVERRRWQRG